VQPSTGGSKRSDSIIVPDGALGTHAYIITRQGAQALINAIEGEIFQHIDFCIQYFASNQTLKTYALSSRIAYQTSTDGTSQSSNVSNKHPCILNSLLSNVFLDTKVSATYITTLSIAQPPPRTVRLVYSLLLAQVFLFYY